MAASRLLDAHRSSTDALAMSLGLAATWTPSPSPDPTPGGRPGREATRRLLDTFPAAMDAASTTPG